MDENETVTRVSLSPERAGRLRVLVDQAQRQPLGQRRVFLAAACDIDTILLSEALATLEADAAIEPLILPSSESMIGPYRIERELGRGGMGVVYLAEQLEPLRRFVALKLLNVGTDTRQAVRRFEIEQQALAVMDHPHIAHVFDAGTTADGRLFFAMEYVAGASITEFCDVQRLPIRARLELFVDVCAAVQHAHQKGVIHRDLKPSNVLVLQQDGQPLPKVIDFGIAKATNHRSVNQTMYTELWGPIGTPEYMSPEQAGALDIDLDTRTDIYSLGVVLYELLVGTVPFDGVELRRAGYGGMQQIIRDIEPERPSIKLLSLGANVATVVRCRRTTPTALVQQLRGDLDWIVLKALEKDRQRRYESASELANDVRRYLEDEPVVARPPSIAYRSWKFARKHRRAAVVASLLLLMLTVGLTVSTSLYIRAERSRQEADEQRRLQELQRQAAEQSATDARRQRDEADSQRRRADAERSAAQAAEDQADRERALAERQQKEAEKQRLVAEQERDEALHHSYRSGLFAADLSIRQGDLEAALRHLEGTDTTLRNWEWRFLRRIADSSVAKFPAFRQVRDVAFRTSNDDLVAIGDFPWLFRSRTGIAGRMFTSKPTQNVNNQPKGPLDIPEITETFIALSPDGERALTSGWNLSMAVATCSASPVRQDEVLCQPAWRSSPVDQSGRLLTAEERDRLNIVDTATGRRVGTIEHPQLGVWTGARAASGRVSIKVGSTETMSTVVDSGSATPLASLSGTAPEVMGATFSADARRLATWSWDNVIHVWDVKSMTHLAALPSVSDAIRGVTFCGLDELLAVSVDGTVRVWVIDGKTQQYRVPASDASAVAVSQSGLRIAIGTTSGAIQLWDKGSTSARMTIPGHHAAVSALAFSTDSSRLASSGDIDGGIAVWDAASGFELARFHGHSGKVLGLSWNRTGELLASASTDRTYRVWNTTESSASLTIKAHTVGVRELAFSAASDEIVSIALDGTLRTWDLAHSDPIRAASLNNQPGEKAVAQLAVMSADGHRIVVPYYSRGSSAIRVVDGNESPPMNIPIDEGAVIETAESGDGAILAAVLRTPTGLRLQVWDSASGHSKFSALVPSRIPLPPKVATTATGTRVAVCVEGLPDSHILVFESASGRLLKDIDAGSSRGFSARPTFASGGQYLFTGHFDGSVHVWEVESGRSIATLRGHEGTVSVVILSSDGKRIITGGADSTVRVWHADRRELLLTLRAPGQVTALAVRPDGRQIAAGTATGTVYVWDAGARIP